MSSLTTPPESITLPLLPLRDVVVFPHMVIPLFVGRAKSIRALEVAMESGKSILLSAQKSAAKDDPLPEDLYLIGSVATILQMLKLPDGTVKVLVEGTQRARVVAYADEGNHFVGTVELIQEQEESGDKETEAARRALVNQFDQYVKCVPRLFPGGIL